MKKQQLGVSDLQVSRISYGCMQIGGTWDDAPITDELKKSAMVSVNAALEAGINFFDHADIYCRGKSETVFSELWKTSVKREDVMIQSKCGIRFAPPVHRFDFSYQHIINTVEGSLSRLKTDYLDVLLLHRPDPLVEPEEVARAFSDLHASGKVRWFGVSNHTPLQIDLLKKYVEQPFVANQIELSVLHTPLLDHGVNYNQANPRVDRNSDLIEYCRLHDITMQAWSPVATGKLAGKVLPKNEEAKRVVDKYAEMKGVTSEAILIAWILRHPAKIQPVPGTTSAERIKNICAAVDVELTREEWYEIWIAGRGEALP